MTYGHHPPERAEHGFTTPTQRRVLAPGQASRLGDARAQRRTQLERCADDHEPPHDCDRTPPEGLVIAVREVSPSDVIAKCSSTNRTSESSCRPRRASAVYSSATSCPWEPCEPDRLSTRTSWQGLKNLTI